MGEVRPLRPWPLLGPPFLTLPPRFVLRRGGGCAGLGGFPPSPVSGCAKRACAPAQEVCPPLILGGGSLLLPLLHLHDVRWDRTLLGKCPLFGALVWAPPSSVCMPCAGSARCLGGPQVASLGFASPHFPACHALGAHADRGVSPPRPPGLGAPPPHSLTCRALGAHAAVRGGFPLTLFLFCTRWLPAACLLEKH